MTATDERPQITRRITQRLSLTDLGNARRLVQHFGVGLRHVGPMNQWLYFDGTRWVRDVTGEVERCAKEAARAIREEADLFDEPEKVWKWERSSKNKTKIFDMIRLAATEPGIAIEPSALDSDPWVLNAKNGVVNLRTGKIEEHSPDDLITRICDAEFDAEATSPEWDGFLAKLTDGDPELEAYLQRAIGCAVSGAENEKALFVFLGPGDTGKSTLLRIIMQVLGDYAIQAERNLLLSRAHEPHPTGIADLFGRRMAVCTEVNPEQRFDVALVKQLTGGDRLKARRMRQDFFEFDPTHTLFLACNDVPRFDPTDEALWNRHHIVPFSNRIPANQQNPHLADELLERSEAILAWVVQGCLEWQRDGLGEPESLRSTKAEHRAKVDPVFRFIEEHFERDDSSSVEATLIYGLFKAFASANGLQELTQRKFGARLTSMGIPRGRGPNGRTTYIGVRTLKDLNLPPLSTQHERDSLITEDPSDGSAVETCDASR